MYFVIRAGTVKYKKFVVHCPTEYFVLRNVYLPSAGQNAASNKPEKKKHRET
jgi:hypothetical protein